MSIAAQIAMRLREPWRLPIIMRVAEILILLAAILALLSVLDPGPINLTLFLVAGQGLIVIGVILYLIVTFINFKRRHGVSHLHFAPGEVVFRQGDPGNFIYTIINGEVEVIREDPELGETTIARLGSGEYFGEMALISDAPRMATVRTLTPVDAVSMGRSDFSTLYMYLPALNQSVDNVMKQRRTAS